jgi:hypothetical protein
MRKTFTFLFDSFRDVIENFSLSSLLTRPLDNFGEVIHDSVIDKVKHECLLAIQELKLIDPTPRKKSELWKLRSEEILNDFKQTNEEDDEITIF